MNEIVIVVRGQNATGPAFSEATGNANKFGGALKAIASAAVIGGLVEIGKSVIGMAGDFQSSTERLVTSAGESQSALDGVRKGILDMAGQVGDSAEELSKAMYTIESGGQHGADGLTVLRAAAEGAKAEGADLSTVADALTSALQDYHLKAGDSAKVTSEMVAAVGAGKTTFEQFAGSLHSVLPIASSAGISFEDISAAIASMTVHGESADQATQNLADTIKHMVAPTQVQTKELAQLGISSGDLAGMLGSKGLTGTLQFLDQTIREHMGPSGKVLTDAFNKSKDAANDANIMIASMPKSLQDLAHAYQNGTISQGDWTKTLKTLSPEQANLLKQFAALQAQASGFSNILKQGGPAAQSYQAAMAAATGDATGLNTALMLTGENTGYVNNALKTISGATTEAGGHVRGWSEIQGTFNQKLSEAKASIGAMAIEVGTKLLPVLGTLTDKVKEGADFLGRHSKAATIAAGIIGGALVIAVLAYAASMASAAVATIAATWPILAIIAAVTLVALGIYELAKHWSEIWKGIKDVTQTVVRVIVNFFLGMVGDMLNAAASAFGWIPGIGPKLKAAAADFTRFRDEVNAALGGIQNKVDINIQGHFYSDVTPQTLAHGLYTGGIATAASGGARGLTWMNERGAELVRLPNGSMVYSHEDSQRMASQSNAQAAQALAVVMQISPSVDSLFSTMIQKAINNGLITISARYVTP